MVQIAGEHEDSYAAAFCVYNDVSVRDGRRGVEIYGYPDAAFPPTDLHTATLRRWRHLGHRLALIPWENGATSTHPCTG